MCPNRIFNNIFLNQLENNFDYCDIFENFNFETFNFETLSFLEIHAQFLSVLDSQHYIYPCLFVCLALCLFTKFWLYSSRAKCQRATKEFQRHVTELGA